MNQTYRIIAGHLTRTLSPAETETLRAEIESARTALCNAETAFFPYADLMPLHYTIIFTRNADIVERYLAEAEANCETLEGEVAVTLARENLQRLRNIFAEAVNVHSGYSAPRFPRTHAEQYYRAEYARRMSLV